MIDDPTNPYGEYPDSPGGEDQLESWWDVINGVWRRMTNPLPGTVTEG